MLESQLRPHGVSVWEAAGKDGLSNEPGLVSGLLRLGRCQRLVEKFHA